MTLNGAVARLANLGGNGNFDKTQYVGVLQQDAAAALAHNEDCRQNIYDSLLGVLFPNGTTPAAPTTPTIPAPSPPQKVVSVCPITAYSSSYLAVSIDGTANNVSGWYSLDHCSKWTVGANTTSVFVAYMIGTPGGGPVTLATKDSQGNPETASGYVEEDQFNGVWPYQILQLPGCASQPLPMVLGVPPTVPLYQELFRFDLVGGSQKEPCNGQFSQIQYYEIPINAQTNVVKVQLAQ